MFQNDLLYKVHNPIAETLGGQMCFGMQNLSDFRKVLWGTCQSTYRGLRQHPIVIYINISTVKHKHEYSH